MKVLNIHKRVIHQPKSELVKLFSTLATKDDKIWPRSKWPAMVFKNGLKPDSIGGHGPIKYFVTQYDPSSFVEFEFLSPAGFNGHHKLELIKRNENLTEITHIIDMETDGFGTIRWLLVIKPLHNALIEDAFDQIENCYSGQRKRTKWNLWVRMLRNILK